jgi:hypothetical protein
MVTLLNIGVIMMILMLNQEKQIWMLQAIKDFWQHPQD